MTDEGKKAPQPHDVDESSCQRNGPLCLDGFVRQRHATAIHAGGDTCWRACSSTMSHSREYKRAAISDNSAKTQGQ
eukprot:4966540-Pyramimonas_sp.AAC.1